MTGFSATCGIITRRRRTAFLALLVGLLLALGLTVAGPASAQNSYKFKNVATGKCLWESGTSSTVYAAACSNTNNSDYWVSNFATSGVFTNVISHKCLTESSDFYHVSAAGCTRNNDYQRWIGTNISGNEFEIIAYATGQCLWSGTPHQDPCSSSNHGDLWTSSE